MLHDSVVVVHTRPQAIPLAMITTRKSTHGFPCASHMCMGLRLAALQATGALLIIKLQLGKMKTFYRPQIILPVYLSYGDLDKEVLIPA